MSIHHKVIIGPAITEKNTMLRQQNKYVFEVIRTATKPQIRAAVEKIFNVKVEAVTTAITSGKFKRMGKNAGYRSDRKKAFVKLAQGQSIAQFGEV